MSTYQLDKQFLFVYTNPDYGTQRPLLSVVTAPPVAPVGMVAKWVTDLNPVTDENFGAEGTGEWVLVEDNRYKTLFDITTGYPYTGAYNGLGTIPEGTTLIEPEINGMVWNGSGWVLSNEQIIEQKKKLISDHIDTAARALGYDSIVNAITYADEPSVSKFQAEGKAFRKWRSECWELGYQIIDDVLNGLRPIPTDDELLNELPILQVFYDEEEGAIYEQQV